MPQLSNRLAKIERMFQATTDREADPLIVLLPPNGRDDSELSLRIARDGVTGIPDPEAGAPDENSDQGR